MKSKSENIGYLRHKDQNRRNKLYPAGPHFPSSCLTGSTTPLSPTTTQPLLRLPVAQLRHLLSAQYLPTSLSEFQNEDFNFPWPATSTAKFTFAKTTEKLKPQKRSHQGVKLKLIQIIHQISVKIGKNSHSSSGPKETGINSSWELQRSICCLSPLRPSRLT